MLRVRLVALLLGTTAALCLPAAAGEPPPAGGSPVTFSEHAPRTAVAFGAGEPMLTVTRDGSVLFQTLLQTMRVTNVRGGGDRSRWADVTSGWLRGKGTMDPILSSDPITGRVFVSHLEGACSLMAASDDSGSTWRSSTVGCGLGPQLDHQSVAAGPFPAGAALGPAGEYRNAVYYCAHDYLTANCAVSLDGGGTFGPAVPVWDPSVCWAPHGHADVAVDGTVYLPPISCREPAAGIGVSTDAGLTWELRRIPESVNTGAAGNPSVATAGRSAYVSWGGSTDGDARTAWVSRTRDRGRTWSRPADLSRDLGVTAVRFLSSVAGDEERAAVSFLGTTARGDANAPAFSGTWRPYVAITLDGGRTWRTEPALERPVHRGPICLGGAALCSGGARILLDFNDLAVDEQGRLYFALAVSCRDRSCSRVAPGSDTTTPLLLTQERGPLLRRAA